MEKESSTRFEFCQKFVILKFLSTEKVGVIFKNFYITGIIKIFIFYFFVPTMSIHQQHYFFFYYQNPKIPIRKNILYTRKKIIFFIIYCAIHSKSGIEKKK